jgi:hypothetical protein
MQVLIPAVGATNPSGGYMPIFNEREEGFEKKFAHDEELKFKAEARRNRLLGLWAAEKLELSGPAAEEYARKVVAANIDAPGSRGVVRKIIADFATKDVAVSEGEVVQKMDDLLATAVAQIKAGK